MTTASITIKLEGGEAVAAQLQNVAGQVENIALAAPKAERAGRSVNKLGGELNQTAAAAERAGRSADKLGGELNQTAAAAERAGRSADKLGGELNQTADAAGRAGRGLKEAGAAADAGGRQAGGLSRIVSTGAHRLALYAASAYGVVGGLRAFAGAINEVDALDNRLALLTDTRDDAAALRQELFDLSRAARVGYGSTAELYARVGQATREMGVGQDAMLQFIETTSQAVALGGSTATEARNALIQLSQGLASGQLRGEELRSVLEQTQGLSQVLADGLGVTIGQLREMGHAGELTAERVLNAVLSQADAVQARFDTFVPTMAQGWQVLTTGAAELADAIDNAGGFTSTLAEAFEWVGDAAGGAADAIHEAIEPSLFERAAAGARKVAEQVGRIRAGGTLEDADADAAAAGLELASDEELQAVIDRRGTQVSAQDYPDTVAGVYQFAADSDDQASIDQSAAAAAAILGGRRRKRAADDANAVIEEMANASDAAAADAERRALELRRVNLDAIADARQRRLEAIELEYQAAVAKTRAEVTDQNHADDIIAGHRSARARKVAAVNARAAAEDARARAAAERAASRAELQAQRARDRRRDAEIAGIEDTEQRALAAARHRLGVELREAGDNYDLRVAAFEEFENAKTEITKRAASDRAAEEAAALRELRDTAVPVPAHLDAGHRAATDLDIAARRASLTEDGADDLAVARDREFADIDGRLASGDIDGAQAAELRALALEEYRVALEQLASESEQLSDAIAQALFGNLSDASRQAARDITGAIRALGEGPGAASLQTVGQAFSSVAAAAVASGQSVEDAVGQMVRAIAARLVQATLEYTLVQGLDLLAQAFGTPPGLVTTAYYGRAAGSTGGSGGYSVGQGRAQAPWRQYHSGGIVGFEGAPRLHTGGVNLGAGELPAILQRGEGVFTPGQMAALAPAAAAPGVVRVEIINESGAALQLDESRTVTERNERETIIRVVAQDIRNGGRVARALGEA